MACACKVNQEIDKLNRYYSYNGKAAADNRPKMKINRKDALITLLIYILLLPFAPLILLFVLLYSAFSRNKRISIKKFLGFIHTVRNGRKQQIIQDKDESRS